MTLWCQTLVLLCFTLILVESSAPPPAPRRNKYNKSFCLTRSTRTRVQELQKIYKEEQLGNKHFEDRSLQLQELPSLSTDFNSWLNLTDWERLHAAFWDMRAYWNMLERKRTQLEREGKEQLAGQEAHIDLPQNIRHIQLDLRDLMNQVSHQMRHIRSSWMRPTPPTHTEPETSSKTLWDSRVEGYIILRDLDLYLTKLARDFLLLASKTHI
ncbi:interleukin-27 subunit alpha [Cheilinus undulatus]|uniref:interleukin-27 subunit alpha n=1 Tax=Cheilinus undulatus TaxID=241271 RepID=UPI001BD32999|nr:interleukin-27 subunit alpha [Cheilinus undulatus]